MGPNIEIMAIHGRYRYYQYRIGVVFNIDISIYGIVSVTNEISVIFR